jgi:diguanylate cyclase (GGDEF)-like protein
MKSLPHELDDPLNATDHFLISALDQTPNLVAIFDEADRLVYSNHAFRQAYGFDLFQVHDWKGIIENAYSRACGPVIETDSIDDWLTRANTRRGTVPFRSFEADFHDGRWFLVTETMQQDGSLLLVAVDISAVKTEGRALRTQRDNALRAAWTDPLTGLANRRYCLDQLRAWHQTASHGTFGALAMIDLDHFKQVNDEYGHEFGDRVLVDFGRFILNGIRLQDLFARIGGEEFLLFFPGCSIVLARTRLEDLMNALGNHSAIVEMPDFRYSFSCGLVLLSPDWELDEALHSADQLLYQAKLAGRARVVNSADG